MVHVYTCKVCVYMFLARTNVKRYHYKGHTLKTWATLWQRTMAESRNQSIYNRVLVHVLTFCKCNNGRQNDVEERSNTLEDTGNTAYNASTALMGRRKSPPKKKKKNRYIIYIKYIPQESRYCMWCVVYYEPI